MKEIEVRTPFDDWWDEDGAPNDQLIAFVDKIEHTRDLRLGGKDGFFDPTSPEPILFFHKATRGEAYWIRTVHPKAKICRRCQHIWIGGMPRVCPKCKSPYWRRPYSRVDLITA
jgi:hypothetical protein